MELPMKPTVQRPGGVNISRLAMRYSTSFLLDASFQLLSDADHEERDPF